MSRIGAMNGCLRSAAKERRLPNLRHKSPQEDLSPRGRWESRGDVRRERVATGRRCHGKAMAAREAHARQRGAGDGPGFGGQP